MNCKINVNDRYGNLTVKRVYKVNNHTFFECVCDCGKKKIVENGYKLYRGNTKSCGCLRGMKCSIRNSKNAKYAKEDNRLVDIWRHMIYRCEKQQNISYKWYGAKGIKVCDEWHDFSNFAKWSKENGYSSQLTIDRIDPSRDYSAENCRWVDYNIQNNNSSHCHYLTFNGKTASLSEWSDITGMPYSTIKSRINKLHWSVEKALTTPCKTNG